jgi:hypothetical protein
MIASGSETPSSPFDKLRVRTGGSGNAPRKDRRFPWLFF